MENECKYEKAKNLPLFHSIRFFPLLYIVQFEFIIFILEIANKASQRKIFCFTLCLFVTFHKTQLHDKKHKREEKKLNIS